jgi:hypothetical protein
MTYDLARARVVLFGGERADFGGESDTWEWDGVNWTRLAPAASPPPRRAMALAYDSARRRIVLFGGIQTPNSVLADTWEWDGSTWTQRSPPASPPARGIHALAYDAARAVVVLFGGELQGLATAKDTWEWNGALWVQRSPATSPPARAYHCLVHDPLRRRVVLFGGAPSLGSPPFLADTWEWTGAEWLQRSPATSPAARAGHTMAHDLVERRSLLFGGVGNANLNLADTWDYAPASPASYATFGSGCAGSGGTPALAAAAGQLPWLGEAFTLELSSLPSNAAALVLFGASRTSWPPFPLPLALGPYGMPGCTLFASGEAMFPAATSGSGGSLGFVVPNATSLVGLTFFNQAFVADPPANRLGLTVSNAGEARIGGK